MAEITIERKPKHRVWPLLALLALLVLVAAGVWWWYGGGEASFAAEADTSAAAEEGYAPAVGEPGLPGAQRAPEPATSADPPRP